MSILVNFDQKKLNFFVKNFENFENFRILGDFRPFSPLGSRILLSNFLPAQEQMVAGW